MISRLAGTMTSSRAMAARSSWNSPAHSIVKAWRNTDLRGQLLLGFCNCALEIAPTNAELHRDISPVVFAVDERCPRLFANFSDLRKGDAVAIKRGHWNIGNSRDVLPVLRKEAHN